MTTTILALALTLPLCGYYVHRTLRRERLGRVALEEASATGLAEPPSLHPVIDEALCIACGACVDACPEGDILGLVGGKAELVAPSHCIGHGACKDACPSDAITLVFGTARRGVDIPEVKPDFETNVPGLFIAGELGGMGLIRNAVEQGRQALESVRKLDGIGAGEGLDVVIVGAGPAGLSASLAALEQELRFVTLEQDALGGTVAHFPRGKIVMTRPAQLPLVGKVRFTETTKEELLGFWHEVVAQTGLTVRDGERVERIEREGRGFRVHTTRGSYATRAVLLAIGRRGTPRRLEVPGEELSKVVYRLTDPEQYRGRRVLVVGGGDSALEAAASLADEPHTEVTLSYRSGAFNRAKPKNRERVERAAAAGRLRVVLNSNVRSIAPDRVVLDCPDGARELPNDTVIVSAGGVLPTPFLQSIGVEVQTKYGTV